LQRLGALVHCLDVGGLPVPEAAGFERLLPACAPEPDDAAAERRRRASSICTGFEETRTNRMNPPPPNARPSQLREAFVYWLKLGFISFGGPAGQIAIMHQELVEKRRWISERRFLHALNYCMVLPGPEAQQLAIYIGWLLHRTWGGIIAGTLFVLPSLFILAALTYVYLAFGDVTFVQGVFNGIKPAVVAIVVFAAWRIGSRALKNNVLWALAAASFIAIFVFRSAFPYIVLAAGILGFIGGKLCRTSSRSAAATALPASSTARP
jgi:chromate transport protein ChrA